MHRLLITFALIGLTALVGCASSKPPADPVGGITAAKAEVTTSFDPSARFPATAFFTWARGFPKLPDDVRVDPLVLEERLRAAIRRELGDKGYMYRGYSPDYIVAYRVAIQAGDFAASGERYTAREGWIPAMAGLSTVERGALAIDIVEASSHQLVWQGVCEANVLMTADDETKRERLDLAVKEILAEFPPRR